MIESHASAAPPHGQIGIELPRKQSLLRRIGRHPRLMHYNRLIGLVLLVNLAVLVYGVGRGGWWTESGIELTALSNLVLANLSLTILIRQQYVINLLFRIATSAPTSWPLSIRWVLGKVYHFGGLHVGGALAGTLWYAAFVGTLAFHVTNGLPGVSVGVLVISGVMVCLARKTGREERASSWHAANKNEEISIKARTLFCSIGRYYATPRCSGKLTTSEISYLML